MEDLLTLTQACVSKLPELVEDSEKVHLGPADIPRIAGTVGLRGLAGRIGTHCYGFPCIDHIDILCTRRSCAALGIALLSGVFHGEEITIELARNGFGEFPLKKIFLNFEGPEQDGILETQARQFVYKPSQREKHALSSSRFGKEIGLPSLFAGTELGITTVNNPIRDCIAIDQKRIGMARLAELLLDISQPGQERDEFVLECDEFGHGGVGNYSAELSIFLPGPTTEMLHPHEMKRLEMSVAT